MGLWWRCFSFPRPVDKLGIRRDKHEMQLAPQEGCLLFPGAVRRTETDDFQHMLEAAYGCGNHPLLLTTAPTAPAALVPSLFSCPEQTDRKRLPLRRVLDAIYLTRHYNSL